MARSARTIPSQAHLAGSLATGLMAGAVGGGVAVELRSDTPAALVGQQVGVRVELSSTTPATVAAAQVLFAWDPAELRLVGLTNAGGASLLTSGLPRPDPHGMNEAAVPGDGDAMYLALARLGAPLRVSEEGESMLLTTLLFETLRPTPDADIRILSSAGSPPGRTLVLDGDTPNLDITGSLSGASFVVVPAPASGLVLLAAAAAALPRRRRDRHA